MVHDDHRALAGGHGEGNAGHLADLAGPGAGGIDHEVAGDADLLTAAHVGDAHRRDAAASTLEAGDPMIWPGVATVLPGGPDVGVDQRPRLARAIRNGKDPGDPRIEQGLAPNRLADRDLLYRDAGVAAGADEPIGVLRIVVRRAHEHPAGVLNGASRNAAQHPVLLDTLP